MPGKHGHRWKLRLSDWLPFIRRRTPIFLQTQQTDCGAASLGSLLAYFGRWVALDDLRQACGVGRDGCSAADIATAATKFGMQAKGWRSDITDIAKLKLPAILFWGFNHFVVLEHVRKGRYYLNDPASGRRVVETDEFDREFTGVVLLLEPSEKFETGGAPPEGLKLMRPWLGGFGRSLTFASLCGLLLAIPGLLIPILLTLFVDYVLAEGHVDWGVVVVAGMLVAALLMYLLAWLQLRALRKLSIMVAIRQSDLFFHRLLRLPSTFFNFRLSGDLMSRMQKINEVAVFMSRQLAGTIIQLTMSLAFLGLMFVYDTVLAIAVGILGLVGLVLMRYMARLRTNEKHQLSREHGMLSGIGMVGLRMIDSLRATASEDEFFSRWSGYQARELNSRQRFAEMGYLVDAIPGLFVFFGGAMVLSLGGWRLMSAEISVGTLMGFYLAAQHFLQPIGRFAQFSELLKTLEADLHRIADVMQAQPSPERDDEAETGRMVRTSTGKLQLVGLLEMRNVTFGFQRNRPPFIENFNLTIEPGHRVAIVGASGSGKSTLARLSTGEYQHWSGDILFDGLRREEVPRKVLTSSISVVDQHIVLFQGTIRENLTMWDPTFPEKHMIEAARDAGIHDAIIARRNGYESLVEEGGSNFSGGQRQRLEIARALISNPSLLILDEATAAMDPKTELEIDNALRQRGCSCLIIAHRISTIRDCDHILVLDKGRVAESGVHEDLIKIENGIYRGLFDESDVHPEGVNGNA